MTAGQGGSGLPNEKGPIEEDPVEDVLSESGTVARPITEHEMPVSRPLIKSWTVHPDLVRFALAMIFPALVGLSVVLGWIGWWCGRPVEQWVTFTTPLYTLCGVVLTFYFTRNRD